MSSPAQVRIGQRLSLPGSVAKIYEAVAELDERYRHHKRRFTPDGHLVGSIGEVVIAEALGLELHPNSYRDHDAHGPMGDVQIKIVGPTGRRVALYGDCNYLIVAQIVSTSEAEIVYCGAGAPVCAEAGPRQKNGQRVISLHRLKKIAGAQA